MWNPFELSRAEYVPTPVPEPTPPEETIEDIIKLYTTRYNYSYEKAYWLAMEESQLDPEACNGEGTSACGVYMFIDSTWEEECEGDKIDAHDNVKCAVRLLSEGKEYHWEADERIPARLLEHGIVL